MNKFAIAFASLIALTICGWSFAQDYGGPEYVPSPGDRTSPPISYPAPVYRLEADQLDQLTGPIALYPDPLIAELLPACTYPTEVLAAAQLVRTGVPAQSVIDAQPWEPAVRALVHYPTVLQMMSERSDWMTELGNAFVNQPDDVMDSIQRLRAEAQESGALASTAQQEVVTEDQEICIRPVADDVIYVPEYDPGVIFVHGRHFDRGAIRFGAACPIGIWLNYGPDWRHHFVREDVHWERWHAWHREHHEAPVRIDRPGAREPRRWTRNPEKPVIIQPRHAPAERRGYDPAPARAPQRGLGDYKPRHDAERDENRGRTSLHQPAAKPAAKPAERAGPKIAPRPDQPAPRPAPAHPAPAPRPQPSSPGHGDGGRK